MFEFIKTKEVNAIGYITLSRPDKHNALHRLMIQEIMHALAQLEKASIRVIVLDAIGEHFCAGGDIAWMRKMGNDDQNYEDAQVLADLLFKLYHFPKPTLCLCQGLILGGGMGLVAASDIAICDETATFGLPEVKIGITPSIISPYVIAALGERTSHYYFLTGERFSAQKALQLGFIHELTESGQLQDAGINLAGKLLKNAPHALTAAKKVLKSVAKEKITDHLAQKTAEHLAHLRTTPEAVEGLCAFLEKRNPNWVT